MWTTVESMKPAVHYFAVSGPGQNVEHPRFTREQIGVADGER